MAGLNKMIVIGNVGTDPEMRYTPNGSPVTSFRIAISRVYTPSDGERRQETEWFTVVAWNQLAEQCNQYLTKGRRAYVEGRLQSRKWEGQDGQTRFTNEIIASRVLFLDKPAGVGGPTDGEPGAEAPTDREPQEGSEGDDLPW